MGVYLRYALGEDGAFEDGPGVATTAGWLAFLDWAEPLSDFPELARFAAEGVAWPAEVLDVLEAELPEAVKAHADTLTPDLTRTLCRLIDALRDRPGGAVAVIATDGTPGGEEEGDGGQGPREGASDPEPAAPTPATKEPEGPADIGEFEFTA